MSAAIRLPGYQPWAAAGWRGWQASGVALDVEAWLAVAASGAGRRSRHARTLRHEGGGAVYVKTWPAPGARRARRAFAMGRALAGAGFLAPVALLAAWRGREGLLVTADAGGEGLADAVTALARPDAGARRARRALCRRLGAEVARLHEAGFVHGDLVPPNVRVRGLRFCFLDNDRTRRLPLAVGARRNLVQLGRFVAAGVTLTDRARVLAAYAAGRGLSRRARRRLGWWVVRKVTARRCTIDGIPPEVAAHAGFRRLMQPGGPFDPALGAAPPPEQPA